MTAQDLRRRSLLPPSGPSLLASHPPQGAEFSFLEFAEYFPHVPAALAIKECVRLKRIKELPVVGPVLDVGCGDGLFTTLAYPELDTWGIDVSESEAARAQSSRAYKHVICRSVTDPASALPEMFFATCIANCSIEHVPDLDTALRNIRRTLRPSGLFYLTVPRRDWTETLPLRRALTKIGLGDLGRAYGAALDSQFVHHHLYDGPGWAARLSDAGFVDVEWEPLGSGGSQAAFEAWLLPSLAGYFTKRVTGRWILSPSPRRLYALPVFRAIKRLLEQAPNSVAPELMIACRAPAVSRP
jgi:SAM-dependent methyltransferase